MDQAQATALRGTGDTAGGWVSWLASSSAVTTRRPEKDRHSLFEGGIVEHSANK